MCCFYHASNTIYLVGADSNEDERQKLLGQKFVLVVIDEAQAFGIDLRQLMYGVLKPAVADYRGTIILTGTPGNLIKGLFFDQRQGSGLVRAPLDSGT